MEPPAVACVGPSKATNAPAAAGGRRGGHTSPLLPGAHHGCRSRPPAPGPARRRVHGAERRQPVVGQYCGPVCPGRGPTTGLGTCSFTASRREAPSSRIGTGASSRKAQVIATRLRRPPDRFAARSPTAGVQPVGEVVGHTLERSHAKRDCQLLLVGVERFVPVPSDARGERPVNPSAAGIDSALSLPRFMPGRHPAAPASFREEASGRGGGRGVRRITSTPGRPVRASIRWKLNRGRGGRYLQLTRPPLGRSAGQQHVPSQAGP